jgi:anti-sigma regulatory factor (Ser/Thr protein kinase)
MMTRRAASETILVPPAQPAEGVVVSPDREAEQGAELHMTLHLPKTTSAPVVARKIVTAAADALRVERDGDALALIVSELVTNAVMHGEAPISLVMTVGSAGSARLEVSDEGLGWVEPTRRVEPAIGGYGLQLVAALSTAWGCVAHSGGGKTVWAESDPHG